MDTYPKLEKKEMPNPPHWTKALGVGIVVTGLAMGTGELIMWPHLVTKYGVNLLWLALLGIVAQYFINHEVARYSISTGESFFTASARVFKWFPIFWFLSAILLYIWPGWASAIGTTLRELFGFGTHFGWAWGSLGLVLIITFLGKRAYVLLEKTLKIIVPTFFLMLVAITVLNVSADHWAEVARGFLDFGKIPKDIDINILLSAIVFAGAGGMLNLCVSLWYRDKQVGMGKYVGRIENPITGKNEAIAATGFCFEDTQENIIRWKKWMRFMRVDQGIVFLLIGFISLLLLSINAHAVLSPMNLVPEGIDVAVVQAHIFGSTLGRPGFILFLVMAFLMLFSVMWTVIDALTRMLSDIIYTNSRAGGMRRFFSWAERIPMGTLYYSIITLVVFVGALLIPMRQPLSLLVISAVLGGLTMAVYTPFLIYMNNTKLERKLRPGIFTNIVMVCISLFFIFFAVRVIQQQFFG
jgi:Mn2+/Fe2+ NRAMP family transporter